MNLLIKIIKFRYTTHLRVDYGQKSNSVMILTIGVTNSKTVSVTNFLKKCLIKKKKMFEITILHGFNEFYNSQQSLKS